MQYKFIFTLIMILVYIGAIISVFSTILNVSLLTLVMSQHALRNKKLLISSIFSDILVSLIVMPLYILISLELYKFKLIYMILDVLFCSASILNMCALAIQKYIKIFHPFAHFTDYYLIVAVWTVAAIISLPQLFFISTHSKNFDLHYQIFATGLSFYIPTIAMIVLYILIYSQVRRIRTIDNHIKQAYNLTQRDIKSKASCTCPNTCFQLTTYPYPKQDHKLTSRRSRPTNTVSNFYLQQTRPSIVSSVLSTNSIRARVQKLRVFAIPDTCLSRSRTNLKNKALTTLSITMASFLICWLPFFVIVIANSISQTIDTHTTGAPTHNLPTLYTTPHTQISPPHGHIAYIFSVFIPSHVKELVSWLGYFYSAINPILHVSFDKQLRKHTLNFVCANRPVTNPI